MHSALPLRSFPNLALGKSSTFVWLTSSKTLRYHSDRAWAFVAPTIGASEITSLISLTTSLISGLTTSLINGLTTNLISWLTTNLMIRLTMTTSLMIRLTISFMIMLTTSLISGLSTNLISGLLTNLIIIMRIRLKTNAENQLISMYLISH